MYQTILISENTIKCDSCDYYLQRVRYTISRENGNFIFKSPIVCNCGNKIKAINRRNEVISSSYKIELENFMNKIKQYL